MKKPTAKAKPSPITTPIGDANTGDEATYTIGKSADFRALNADQAVIAGFGSGATLIFIRNEPGEMVQGVTVVSREPGHIEAKVISNKFEANFVQAAHVTMDHKQAVNLAVGIIKFMKEHVPGEFTRAMAEVGE